MGTISDLVKEMANGEYLRNSTMGWRTPSYLAGSRSSIMFWFAFILRIEDRADVSWTKGVYEEPSIDACWWRRWIVEREKSPENFRNLLRVVSDNELPKPFIPLDRRKKLGWQLHLNDETSPKKTWLTAIKRVRWRKESVDFENYAPKSNLIFSNCRFSFTLSQLYHEPSFTIICHQLFYETKREHKYHEPFFGKAQGSSCESMLKKKK